MKDKFEKLIEVIGGNNSNTEAHREQHKCLWLKINSSASDIDTIKK